MNFTKDKSLKNLNKRKLKNKRWQISKDELKYDTKDIN